jgi:hypothetical protein
MEKCRTLRSQTTIRNEEIEIMERTNDTENGGEMGKERKYGSRRGRQRV